MKTLLMVLLVLVVVVESVRGYSHDPVQYHIQTDTGPDRYFRFQTYDGQYRKEKRLDDGTVFGTYGWVDATGILRLFDYVADSQGYRIVRQRTLKVKPVQIPSPPPRSSGSSGLRPLHRKPVPLRGSSRGTRVKVRPISSGGTRTHSNQQTFTANSQSTTTVQPFVTTTSRPEVTTVVLTTTTPTTNYPQQVNSQPGRLVPVTRERVRGTTGLRRRPLPTRRRRPQLLQSNQKPSSSTSSSSSGSSGNSRGSVGREGGGSLRISNPIANSGTQLAPSEQTGKSRDPGSSDDLPEEGTFTVNYDLGNQFHLEKILADGTKVGKHGYVDPLGILRVTHYTSGPRGHKQRQESRWVGARDPHYR